MKKLVGLTIDNGGSESRSVGLHDISLTTKPNDFVLIRDSDFRVRETEDPLELCRVIDAPKNSYFGIIACGMTGKLYNHTEIRLDSQVMKTSNANYYKQIIYMIARDAISRKLRSMEEARKDELSNIVDLSMQWEPDELVEYVITSCIPVKEHSGNADCASVFKAELEGIYEVEFPLIQSADNRVRFQLKKELMGVVPEGGVAMVGLRKELTDDMITLVFDFGHVTIDLALFKGAAQLGKVISSEYAGSTLIANVRAALKDEGYFVTEEQAQRVIETGFVMKGAVQVDVTKLLTEQKRMFVQNYARKDVLQLINMNAVNAGQVQNIVPIGAPMNDGVIVEELISSCRFGDARVKKLAEDLRYVNIEQAKIFTKVLMSARENALKKDGIEYAVI